MNKRAVKIYSNWNARSRYVIDTHVPYHCENVRKRTTGLAYTWHAVFREMDESSRVFAWKRSGNFLWCLLWLASYFSLVGKKNLNFLLLGKGAFSEESSGSFQVIQPQLWAWIKWLKTGHWCTTSFSPTLTWFIRTVICSTYFLSCSLDCLACSSICSWWP